VKASSFYLKGSRCDSPKCAIERPNRNTPPGMHNRRGKLSEYGVRLREKQKLKRFYGVLERQFRRYFELASRSTENTGEVLLSILERRLDNVVHRLGFAPSAGRPPGSSCPTATCTSTANIATSRASWSRRATRSPSRIGRTASSW